MTNSIHNFSAGPGALPDQVIEEAREGLRALPGVGISVLGISHRSKHFQSIMEEAEDHLRHLLQLPPEYKVLLLQGGASLQFSMIPMNLLRGRNRPADYIVSGYWSKKAIKEAQREGEINVVWDGEAENFCRVPKPEEMKLSPNAEYLHYCSNETIEGIQFPAKPDFSNAPVVCDMSSDFLSRPFDINDFVLVYAHAQKNFGPSGVTIVILREDLLENIPDGLHTMLDYRPHVENNSAYNTPPVFSIYFVMLIFRWLRNEIGGLEKMAEINQRKASIIYDTVDQSDGFYRGHADAACRSNMNIVFNLADREIEPRFVQEAEKAGLIGLNGHRSVGGIRASMYNPMTVKGAQALHEFMQDFQKRG